MRPECGPAVATPKNVKELCVDQKPDWLISMPGGEGCPPFPANLLLRAGRTEGGPYSPLPR